MTVTTTAHANFRGQAREALTFYHSVFGGDLALATYADIHAAENPGQADHIAFGRVKAPNGSAAPGSSASAPERTDQAAGTGSVTGPH